MSHWTTGTTKLDCPTCGKAAEGMSLVVDFIFVDGVRHRAGQTWRLSCEHLLHDAMVDWETDEDADGTAWSGLVDVESGDVLLAWCDGTPDNELGCECDDCDETCEAGD